MQENPHPRGLGRILVTLGGLGAIGLADGLFKYLALRQLPAEGESTLSPIIALAVHKNPGILFDLPLPLFVIAPLTLLALGALAYIFLQAWQSGNFPAACGAWAAALGALNNLLDRLINNFTTDYLIFFRTSAINLSDVLILLGVACLLWYGKTNSPAQQKN